MRVIKPITISDSTLISSTEADDLTAAEWDTDTIYTTGAEVQHEHTTYTSLQDSNQGNTPGPNSEWWSVGSPSNRWAMFDNYKSTQTVGQVGQDLEVVLSSSQADSLVLLNCSNIASVRIRMEYTPTGSTVLDRTVEMVRYSQDAVSASWWEYFYGDVEYRDSLVVDFDSYTQSQITLTLTPVTGYAPAVGHCLPGRSYDIGDSLFPLTPSLTDYSTQTTDDDGRTSLVIGSYAENLDVDLEVDASSLDTIWRILRGLRAVPAVWDGNQNDTAWDAVISYGFIREYEIIIKDPSVCTYNLNIEGLI